MSSDLQLFHAFTKQFSDQEIKGVHSIARNYFLVNDDIWELREKIMRDPFATGIFLGEAQKHFMPSPAAIDIISRFEDANRKKIFINPKAEGLFLCGRSVLETSIVRNPNQLKEGLVLVQNARNENLGYGLFKQEGKDLVIKRLVDKGMYLRSEERKRPKKE
ncbi:MAG: hypothetical protein WC916_00755 [Candidatus Woesearchaeota archaeon]